MYDEKTSGKRTKKRRIATEMRDYVRFPTIWDV